VEKERRIKTLTVIALIVAILGLTVAFAAMSKTLTINGTANVDAASWDIHFENLKSDTYGAPTINSTAVISDDGISNIDITLEKPDDEVDYTFDVVNNGSINAKIGSIEVSQLCTLESSIESCDWDNDGTVTESDIEKIDENVSFIISYDDYNPLNVGDTLNVGETKNLIVIITYGKLYLDSSTNEYDYEEATEIPSRDLVFKDLSIKINYVQAD
jgi:hypothetical protein